MIWTLTFIVWLASGEAKVGGSSFHALQNCTDARAAMVQTIKDGKQPEDAVVIAIGDCVVWINPVGEKSAKAN